MTDLIDVYNNLLQSSYCVTVRAKPLYYTFFKPLIEKYLADTTKNYHIYMFPPMIVRPTKQFGHHIPGCIILVTILFHPPCLIM